MRKLVVNSELNYIDQIITNAQRRTVTICSSQKNKTSFRRYIVNINNYAMSAFIRALSKKIDEK